MAGKKLKPKTIETAGKLVDWYSKLENMKRASSLEAFTDAHKDVPSKSSLKQMMMQLSYASIEPEKLDMRKVPKSHRDRVRALREVLDQGILDKTKTEKACRKYLDHGIHERISELPDFDDKEIKGMQEKFGENLNKLAKEYAKNMDAHPVRVYGVLWRWTGNKVHNEVPGIIRDSHEEDLVHNMRKLWHSNYLKAHASWQYQKATNLIIDLNRKLNSKELDVMPSKEEEKLIRNLYKSMDRISFRTRKSAPAFHTRDKLVKEYDRMSTHVQLDPGKADAPLYKKKLIEIGRHLKAGTRVYHESMKQMDKIKKRKRKERI